MKAMWGQRQRLKFDTVTSQGMPATTQRQERIHPRTFRGGRSMALPTSSFLASKPWEDTLLLF